MNDSLMVKCPKCDGNKLIFSGRYMLVEESGECSPINSLCSFCNGEGKVLQSLRDLTISKN